MAILETGLRIVGVSAPEPVRSLIQEAGRMRLSNVRVTPRSNAIQLPPPHDAEILVVGDSFPFGTYERASDVYPSLIGKSLHMAVVNLGISGLDPPQYNRMLEVGARYHPRLVIYAVFANDFAYDSEIQAGPLALDQVFASVDGDDALFATGDDTRRTALRRTRAVTNYSLGYALFKILQQFPPDAALLPWRHHGNFFLLADRSYWDREVAWENTAVRRGVVNNTRLIAEAYRFTVNDLGARFLVVLQPSKSMVYGPLTGNLRPRVYSESWDRTYAELRRRVQDADIPIVDATPGLRAGAARGLKLYHSIDGHLNQRGHEAIAGILTEALRPMVIH